MLGKYVIVRSSQAGVFAGILEKEEGDGHIFSIAGIPRECNY